MYATMPLPTQIDVQRRHDTQTRNGSERSFVDFFCRHIKEMIRMYAAVIRNNDTQRIR